MRGQPKSVFVFEKTYLNVLQNLSRSCQSPKITLTAHNIQKHNYFLTFLFFIKNLLKDFLPQKMLFLNMFWYCRFWNQKWNLRGQPKSIFVFAKTYLNVLQNLSRSCQSPKTTLTPQNIQKHNYFLTFLFFIKNLLKDFLPKKMLFLNIFWYCRFWNQKWNFRRQPKSLFLFAKTYLNVLQNLSRSCQSPKTTLTPHNIQKHNYFLTFLFFIKNLLKDFLPKKMLFLNIFWYCRFWNQKWNLRGQPKSVFVFEKTYLNVLQNLSRSCQSTKITLTAHNIQKHNYFLTFLFFIKNLLKDFLPQKMLFLNMFWYCRFWNQKWNLRGQPKSIFVFAKTYLNVLQNLSRSCQSPKTTLTPQNIQKHNYFLTFLFFIKNLLKDFLPQKMLFLNIFWYCRFWNQKWNLRGQPKSVFVFEKTHLNVLQHLSRSCQSPKTTLTPQNIQKHNYFLTFFFFIKNLLKDFLPKKMLFLNIFWYCRFWNQKWNLRGQPKSLFVFEKTYLTVLQISSRSCQSPKTTLTPQNIQKHNYFLTFFFLKKNLLKDFLPKKMLFLNIFWYCRFWNQKWNFRRQPKSLFVFEKTYLNVLQNLSRSCQSPKTTLTPQNIQKHNYFLTFLFFIKNLLKDFLPKKMLFLNIFWYCRFWNQKWNLRGQPKSLFVFEKTYLDVLQNLSRSCQSPKTTLTPHNIQKHNYFLTFLFFIKNLLKDFLPKKMLFLNIFWYCRFWNQKWNLRGKPKSVFVFEKTYLNVLQNLSRSCQSPKITLTAHNIQKHNYFLTFLFFIKNLLKDFLPQKMLFLNMFWYCRFWNQKWNLRGQPKSIFVFAKTYLNVLQNLSRSCQSPKITLTAQNIQKHNYFLTFCFL